jgi:DNA-binding beta-propeller fold protein YncE
MMVAFVFATLGVFAPEVPAIAGTRSITPTAQPVYLFSISHPSGSPTWRPTGVAVDPKTAAVYVVGNAANYFVEKLGPQGYPLLEWGTVGVGPGKFYNPQGVAVGLYGNVYVSDEFGGIAGDVQEYTAKGAFARIWGLQNGELPVPWGVATDSVGDVYVACQPLNAILKFTPQGSLLAQFTVPSPRGVALDASGNIYASDVNGLIYKLDPQGNELAMWGGNGNGPGQFVEALNMAVDNVNGFVYVVDGNNGPSGSGNRVERFDLNGNFLVEWGSQGSAPGQFNDPLSVAVAPNGNIYVTDRVNQRVEVFGLQ